MAPGELLMASKGLQAARQALLMATDRDGAVDAVLSFASIHFAYAAAFSISSGEIQGRDAIGAFSRGSHRAAVRRAIVRPPWGSMFRSAIDTGGHSLGPGPVVEFDKLFLSDLGRDTPKGVLLVPVRVRGRPVMLLYADNGPDELPRDGVVDVLTISAALTAIFEALIRRRKSESLSQEKSEKLADRDYGLFDAVAAAANEAPLEAVALHSPLPDIAGDAGRPAPLTIDRRLDSPALMVERLAMGDEPEPALLMALATHGDQGAWALAERFPGPIRERANSFAAMDRDPMAHGPVVAAMAFLGPLASEALISLTASTSPESRLYAAFLFGISPDTRALPRLLELLSDTDPRVATAARAAIAAHRAMPGFDRAMEELRGELGRRDDPLRLCDVLRTVAHLADGGAVTRIIDLLGHGDKEVVAEAEGALFRITKQSHGLSQRRWLRWHEANRHLPRLAWLVEGLSNRSLSVREAAFKDLVQETGETFEFDPNAPKGDRAAAVDRWSSWMAQRLGPVSET